MDSEEFEAQGAMMDMKKMRNRTFLAKVLWFVLIAGTLAGFTYQTVLLVHSYLQYPILTTNYPQNVSYEFPDVTICHGAQFMNRKNYTSPTGMNYITQGFLTAAKAFWNAALLGNVTAPANTSADDLEMRYTASEVSFWHYMASLSIIPGPEDVLPMSVFNGEHATLHNFTVMFLGSAGFCFRFQPLTQFRNVTSTGPGTGLVLILRNDNYNYARVERIKTPMLAVSGTKIFVHPPNTIVNLAKRTELVQTGLHIYMPTSIDQINRITTPIQNCRTRETVDRCYLTRQGRTQCSGFVNDNILCQGDVFQQNLVSQCGCYSHDWLVTPLQRDTLKPCYAAPPEAMLNKNVYQNTSNNKFYVQLVSGSSVSFDDLQVANLVTTFKCYYNFMTVTYLQLLDSNTCDDLCIEQVLTVSTKRVRQTDGIQKVDEAILKSIPKVLNEARSLGYDTSFIESEYNDIINYDDPTELTMPMYTNDGSMIDVYPDAALGTLSVQDYRYYFIVFVSDIGGNLGLWLGCCIITVFKFVELISMAGMYLSKQRQKRKHEQQS